ncbi:MAG: TetR/AcrR family transcriptional regulator [Pseudomonadales bacterium]
MQLGEKNVRERLLEAAAQCFLDNDYHQVSTRMIAERAGANVSMIRYYFFNKEGLYQETLLQALQPLLDVLDERIEGIEPSHLLRECYQLLPQRKGMTKLLLKALCVERGPGRDVVDKIFAKIVNHSLCGGAADSRSSDAVTKMTLLGTVLAPLLLGDLFAQNYSGEVEACFLDNLASSNSRLLCEGAI